MPASIASCARRIWISCPSRKIWPASAGSTPERILRSVDLPAPLSPTRPSTSCRLRAIDASASATTAPKRRAMWRASSTGMESTGGVIGADDVCSCCWAIRSPSGRVPHTERAYHLTEKLTARSGARQQNRVSLFSELSLRKRAHLNPCPERIKYAMRIPTNAGQAHEVAPLLS